MATNNSQEEDLSFVVLGPSSRSPNSLGSYHSSHMDSDSSIKLPHKLDEIIAENRELRDVLHKTNVAMKSQFESLSKWQHEVLEAHQNHKEKFTETRNLVFQLKADNAMLLKQLNESHDLADKYSMLSDTNKKLAADNLVLVKERNAFREECTRLTHKIIELEDQIAKPHHSQENELSRGNYKSFTFLGESAMVSSSESDRGRFECKSERNPEENMENTIFQLKENVRMQCDENAQLTEKLRISCAEVEKLNNELVKKDLLLNSSIKELKGERDETAIIRARMEVYKSDYEEERAAREQAVGDKENLAEQLRIIQDKLLRLENQGHQDTALSPPASDGTSDVTTSQCLPDSDEPQFTCPMCGEKFITLDECELHVNHCIDNPPIPVVQQQDGRRLLLQID